MSSRISIVLLAGLLGATACADVRRGEYWRDPEDGSPAEDSGGAMTTGDAEATADTTAAGDSGSSGGTEGGDEPRSFETDVLPLLRAGCERCHSADGQANDTTFILGDDVEDAYATTLEFVDLDAPTGSRLLTKGAGQGHIGGVIFDDRSSQYQTILLWIEQGALP